MTTWDGQPITAEQPYGACIVVYRRAAAEVEYLILHRRQVDTAGGDWAWTPPTGARWPDEPLEACAHRELLEETGLDLTIELTACGDDDWPVFAAEAPVDAVVQLDDEHDDYAWVPIDVAQVRCLPARVAQQIRGVADAIAG